MNEDKFGMENNNAVNNEPVTYDSYYNHKPQKRPWPLIIAIVIIAVIAMVVSLWYTGAFTPMDREEEYEKLYARVCAAAVNYATDNYVKEEPGQIIYVTVGELIEANLIEATLRNYVTNEPIDSSTDIRIELLPSNEFQCHGFQYPGDDTVKPVVLLKGDAVICGTVGTRVTDPGATATDDKDGDISDSIKRSGNVNVDVPGTYTVNYVVTDRSGNQSDVVIRTYIIQ